MTKLSVGVLLSRAKSSIKKGEYWRSVELYQEVLRQYPGNIKAREGLTLAQSKLGGGQKSLPQDKIDHLVKLIEGQHFAAAMEQATNFSHRYPYDYLVWNLLGAAQSSLGLRDAALLSYKKVTELNNTFTQGFNNLGIEYKKRGQVVEATKAFEDALALQADFPEALYNLANLFTDQLKFGKAIEYYDKFLALRPNDPDGQNAKADALKKQSKQNLVEPTSTKILTNREYKSMETLSADPLVAVTDKVLTPAECDYLISLAKPNIRPAAVVVEGAHKEKVRTGWNTWLDYEQNEVVNSVGKRIAQIVGLPLAHAEDMQVIYYSVGQEYQPHYDAYDLASAASWEHVKFGGQRLLTALVYLNTVDSGGGTHFPKLGVSVRASPGRMVVFQNTTEDDVSQHPLSLHAGMPVLAGEKWAFNIWFRKLDIDARFERQ